MSFDAVESRVSRPAGTVTEPLCDVLDLGLCHRLAKNAVKVISRVRATSRNVKEVFHACHVLLATGMTELHDILAGNSSRIGMFMNAIANRAPKLDFVLGVDHRKIR